MKERVFRFKKFSVSHSRSAMKVGVDGVLIGAWGGVKGKNLLDAGTGCGVVALMIAQRNPDAHIEAIDIDSDSVEEAKGNVALSPWNDRVEIKHASFAEICDKMVDPSFDAIVSNPPFFTSGMRNLFTPREKSRHAGTLSPEVLITEAKRILKPGGTVSMIFPEDFLQDYLTLARGEGMESLRICHVKDHAGKPGKRTMIELKIPDGISDPEPCRIEHLIMFRDDGEPTEDYRSLCKDFYLRF